MGSLTVSSAAHSQDIAASWGEPEFLQIYIGTQEQTKA